jgi:hypothetical protein
MAMVRSVSVRDFMKQAVFAVEARNSQKPDVEVIWNNFGRREARVTLRKRVGEEILIRCCPLPPCDGTSTVPRENTFEFQSLSRQVRGTHAFSLDYKEGHGTESHPDNLILTVESRNTGKPVTTETLEWIVYYDSGACVIFIDFDKHEEISGAQSDGLDLASKSSRNKRCTRAYKRWNTYRRDPGKFFWEGLKTADLELHTLDQFEVHDEDEIDFMPPIMALNKGSASAPKPASRNSTGNPGRQSNRKGGPSQQKRGKLGERRGRGRGRGKRREMPSLGRTDAASVSSSQTVTECDAEGQISSYSSRPASERSQPFRGLTQPTREPEMEVVSSPYELDATPASFAPRQALEHSHS